MNLVPLQSDSTLATMGLLLHTFLSTDLHAHFVVIVPDCPTSLWVFTGIVIFFISLYPPFADFSFHSHTNIARSVYRVVPSFSLSSPAIGSSSCDQKTALVAKRVEYSFRPGRGVRLLMWEEKRSVRVRLCDEDGMCLFDGAARKGGGMRVGSSRSFQ